MLLIKKMQNLDFDISAKYEARILQLRNMHLEKENL